MDKVAAGRPFHTIYRYVRPYKWLYLGGALLGLTYSIVELGVPFVVRRAVEHFQAASASVGQIWLLFAILIAIALLAGVARFFQRSMMIGASRKFEFDLRNDYFQRVSTLSREFFNRTQTGDVMARATNDLNYVRMFVGPGIMGSIDFVRLPLTFAVMLYLSWQLSLVTLIPGPLVSLGVYFFVMYMHRQSKRVQDQFGNVSARAQENLAGARVVKAYGVADRELRDFRRESEHYMGESLKLAIVTALLWPAMGLLVGGTMLFILGAGGYMVIESVQTLRPQWTSEGIVLQQVPFTLEDYSAFIVCMVMLAWPMMEFGWVLTLYQRGSAAMGRILDVMTTEPAISDSRADHSKQHIEGAIQFDNVDFGFESHPVLKNAAFRVQSGQTTAVVGPTGSGKSTIVSLICREYDPTGGAVYVDGQDLREIPLDVLRSNLGLVPQDAYLFSMTIRENLRMGKPNASDEEMRAACDVAQFTETLDELPRGFDTYLGERGVNLSGGQKQRLTIARAVLRAPAILILDDALSSVDTHTEEEILKRLRTFMQQRTSIIISHRVSTVQHADQILVLDEGEIVERGTHDELVAAQGLYSDMHARQLLEEQLEDEEETASHDR